MRTCSVCDQEISTRMIRQGGALSRGNEYYHRDCHRTIRPAMSGAAGNAGTAGIAGTAGAGIPAGTSYPEIAVGGEPASFGRRLGAHLLDGVILNLVVMAACIPLGITIGLSGGQSAAGSVVGGLIGFVLPVVYYIWFWSRTGATPGKKLLGIAVVTRDGSPPTGVQSFMFCLGFLWMLWDSEGRTWHDRMAGTRVIRG
jgi:uncharacterized RDD family membrane protein YckC